MTTPNPPAASEQAVALPSLPLVLGCTTPVEAVPAIWTWQSGPKSMACLVGRGDAQGQVPRS